MRARLFATVLLAMAVSLTSCSSTNKKQPRAQAQKKAAKTNPSQENTDVDFDAFVQRLRKAVAAHDLNTIAAMMTPDFGYSLNPERSGDGVFKFWDENNIWPEVEGILAEKFVKKQDYMVSPPQFADASLNYDGYRAGIRRINGSWKFAYFVNG
ncbi:MAG: hypothetical protein QOH31_1837 [Verrucomicrobiota bacterium]